MTGATTTVILLLVIACWLGAIVGQVLHLGDGRRLRWSQAVNWPQALALGGLTLAVALIAALWITLDRPPLRTLGETRLWYAVLTAAAGELIAWRCAAPWLRLPLLALAALFLAITAANPASLDRTLMPALQSAWFVPHVVVYLLAYALLGLSAVAAATQVWRRSDDDRLALHLVQLGLPCLTAGMVLGAVWAKGAWGHYWAWDPKETWALLTWLVYVALIHATTGERPWRGRPALIAVAAAFSVVLACWFLVNHLPSAETSVHTYTRSP